MKNSILKKGDIVQYKSEIKFAPENRYEVIDVYTVPSRGDNYFVQVRGAGGTASRSWSSSPRPAATFPESGWVKVAPDFQTGDIVVYTAPGEPYRDEAHYYYRLGEIRDTTAQLFSMTLTSSRTGEPLECGFWNMDRLTLKERPEPKPQEGDRVQIQLTGTVLDASDEYIVMRTNIGDVIEFETRELDGKPTIVKSKPKTKPWKMGETVENKLGTTYHVQALLTNDWCVLLRDGTTADFKLAHKNDPAFTRSN